jgi:hypothetical protein
MMITVRLPSHQPEFELHEIIVVKIKLFTKRSGLFDSLKLYYTEHGEEKKILVRICRN